MLKLILRLTPIQTLMLTQTLKLTPMLTMIRMLIQTLMWKLILM